MEDSSNPPKLGVTLDLAGNLLTETDEEVDMSSQFPIQEELIEEVMQELYKEISLPSFPVDSGKNGSCGASVSDSESTVMAGIEFVGKPGKSSCGKVLLAGSKNGCLMGEKKSNNGSTIVVNDLGEMTDDCDGSEFDDEWLERVLSWDSPDLVIE